MSAWAVFLAAFAGAALPVAGLVAFVVRMFSREVERQRMLTRQTNAYRAMMRDIMADERREGRREPPVC